jgi:hypothetical protein
MGQAALGCHSALSRNRPLIYNVLPKDLDLEGRVLVKLVLR